MFGRILPLVVFVALVFTVPAWAGIQDEDIGQLIYNLGYSNMKIILVRYLGKVYQTFWGLRSVTGGNR